MLLAPAAGKHHLPSIPYPLSSLLLLIPLFHLSFFNLCLPYYHLCISIFYDSILFISCSYFLPFSILEFLRSLSLSFLPSFTSIHHYFYPLFFSILSFTILSHLFFLLPSIPSYPFSIVPSIHFFCLSFHPLFHHSFCLSFTVYSLHPSFFIFLLSSILLPHFIIIIRSTPSSFRPSFHPLSFAPPYYLSGIPPISHSFFPTRLYFIISFTSIFFCP